MNASSTQSNKRIAKNTIFLYIRLLFLLIISLYTSRVILQVLGIDDYGVYNVVGGVVVMFAFINNALTTGTQRHISYELGKKNGNLARIFTACFKTHLALAGVFFVLSETIGLWFVNTQMNFPEGRLSSANFVYQFTILTSLLGIAKTPYEATVVANERMDFYAVTGIIEAILKLLLVISLKYVLFDKLIAYSIIVFTLSFFIFVSFIVFVHKQFKEIRIIKITDKTIYRYILSFSGWTLFGALSSLLETQGLNIIINISWGVALNAAVGVASQVRGAMYQFVSGFQKALSPQLVITESNGEIERQLDLIYKASRFSFYLMLIMTIPMCLNIKEILGLWLESVPKYASEICMMMLFISLIESLSYPLYTTIFAIGKIKRYQIIVAAIRCLSLVAAIILAKMPIDPYLVFIAPCISAYTILVYRILFLNKVKGLSINSYLVNVLFKVIAVSFIAVFPLYLLKHYIDTQSVYVLFIVIIVSVLWIGIVILSIGMNKSERIFIINKIVKR